MKLIPAPAERILQCVEAVAHGFDTYSLIVRFVFDKDPKKVSTGDKSHLSRALGTAVQLGLLVEIGGDGQERKFALGELHGLDARRMTDSDRQVLFRERLQRFPPFLKFFDLLTYGYACESAAAKVTGYFDISPELKGTNNILAQWGTYSGILRESEEGIRPARPSTTLAPTHPVRMLEELVRQLDSELAARSHLAIHLGQDAFDFLDEPVRTDLVSSLLKLEPEPEEALRLAGLALEDHLKKLARERNIPLVNQKGKPLRTIGAIIQKLRQEKVLADHHQSTLRGIEVFLSADVLNGLNAYRIMPSHGKNLEADQRWSLGGEIAVVVVLQIILVIRSTYWYAVQHRLVY